MGCAYQNLLEWLYNSMEMDIASEVMGCATSQELWKQVQQLVGMKNRANIVCYKKEFQTTRKGGMAMSEYLKMMKNLADNLALAGHPISSNDLATQVLSGLDSNEYNPVVFQLAEKESITWIELQSKLLTYEKRLEQMNASITSLNLGSITANFVNLKNPRGARGNTDFHNRSYPNPSFSPRNPNQSHRGGRSRGRGGRHYNSGRVICQICNKAGHTANVCYYRHINGYNNNMEASRSNSSMSVLTASPELVADPSWYVDSVASVHVTSDAENLVHKNTYQGKEQLIIGNGQDDRSSVATRED